jgi:hypothetical protein
LIVVSNVPLVSPPATRLPGSTRRLEIRPPIGARTCVNSTSSARARTRASAAAIAAVAARTRAVS